MLENTQVNNPTVAVIIPHYQKQPGLLGKAVSSVFAQNTAASIHVYVIDDSSPVPAQSEIDGLPSIPSQQITIVRQPNGGAGSARNRGLELLPRETQFVAFLDSDDQWQPAHLDNALHVMGSEYDAYFSDWWSFNFPEQTNFQRIGTLKSENHKKVAATPDGFDLGVTPIEHILSDGGGVIQTSTVVYRFNKFPELRFREEFYNGQDFFFWMDLGELGAKFAFSTQVDCHNGEGINIYQSAGWGTERSLQRLRNELFVWTSVRRFYVLTKEQRDNNTRTIRNLETGVVRDVVHRIRRHKPIPGKLLADIARFDPYFLLHTLTVPLRLLANKLAQARTSRQT